MKVIYTRLVHENGEQTFKKVLYTPGDIIKCHFGTFDKFTVQDVFSYPKGNVRRFIFLDGKCKSRV